MLLSVYRYHSRICVRGQEGDRDGVGRGTRMGEVLASVGEREEAGGDTAAGQVRSKGLRIG